jgi:alpha-galactosidase
MNADILRLESPDPSVLAELHMAEDGSQFVIFANKIDTSHQIAPRPLRACKLLADAYYKVSLVNSDEIPELSRGAPHLKSESMCVSGRYLMGHGLTLPWSFPNQVWVIKGVRQK